VSQEAVERIRQGYDAFNRGDLAVAAQGFSPDIEWRVSLQLPDSPPDETYRGPEGVMRFWETWRTAFDDFRLEVEEIIDAGDRVVVFAAVRGRGAGSGVDVKTPSFPQVWTMDDEGRPVRVEMYQSRAEALEAVGLSENVAFMRKAFHAFAAGDVTALAGFLDPDVQWQAVEDPEPKRGFEGVLESLAGWFEIWDEVHVELEELIDGGTNVVAVVNERGRHAGSEKEVNERFFQVWTTCDERIKRFREFRTRRDALEAAGLA
jgi:ketosteroid isomerase-like protein